MSQASVAVTGLSEEYRRLTDREFSLKEAISRFRLPRRRSHIALQDIDISIPPGQTVGLIGENGSGKSTLLKCMAGILRPTSGSVLVSGPVSSLIELGAGFHPELTGRENVMVAGVLMGMTHDELLRKMETIVAFAELASMIDEPVRSYSSGMYVRLAFSLAVHVEPEILLIDEALAVGDESFQRKCLSRVRDLEAQVRTIVFVSHDLELVRRVCRRTIWLHEGRIAADGPTDEVISRYLAAEDLKSGGPEGP